MCRDRGESCADAGGRKVDEEESISNGEGRVRTVQEYGEIRQRTSSTSPSCENFLSIISPSCGNSSHAYSAGAVASPSFRSAPPPGLPSSAAEAVKSSMSSMSCGRGSMSIKRM